MEAMCFIFEPNNHVASYLFALQEQGGVALLVEAGDLSWNGAPDI